MFWLAALTSVQALFLELIWPSRAGPRAGPSTLRSACARRRRRGSPRCAARASPLHLSGLVGSSPFPRSLSSATVSAAVFATLRKRAAPPPGLTRRAARASSLRSSGPAGPPGSPGSLPLDLRVDLRARVPVGPPLRPPSLGGVHLKGGRAPPPGRYFSPVGGRGSLPAGGVLSSAYASIYVRARRSGRRYARRRSAVSTSGGTRALSPSHPPLLGGDGGGRGPLLGSTVPARR